ncbi:MAG: hypothetical protein R2941_09235 [Desulfobacterales bacterium]
MPFGRIVKPAESIPQLFNFIYKIKQKAALCKHAGHNPAGGPVRKAGGGTCLADNRIASNLYPPKNK